MRALQQIAKENGFEYQKVTAEEREDGVGVVVGDNWIAPLKPDHKVNEWYTTAEMLEELGLPEIQVKSCTLDAKVSLETAKQSALDWLKNQRCVWYSIERCKQSFGNTGITITVFYGK